MKSEKRWVLFLACLLMGALAGCDGADDDTGDDDDVSIEGDESGGV